MNIEDNKPKTIFRNEVNGKALYSIGISHKKQDGSWENGYMSCRFPKDADIPNKAKIKIVSGWIDFYIKEKVTHPYIFINKYEIIGEELPTNQTGEEDTQQDIPQNIKTDYQDSDIQLTDADLPF